MSKFITESQQIGARGEAATKLRFLEIGFQFDGRSPLEAGIDGIAEVMLDGHPLAKMIAVQVKATEKGAYTGETDNGFSYLMRSEDLEYWKGTNLPIILVLYRISDGSFYWKSVELGGGLAERRLEFNKANDVLNAEAKDKLAALCVAKSGQGHFVPPLQGGETAVINMIPIQLPDEMFVATSQHSVRKALSIILEDKSSAQFDWIIFNNSYWSFRDPTSLSSSAIVDLDQVEAIETDLISNHEDDDQRNQFAFLLRKTLGQQFNGRLRWVKDKKLFYVLAKKKNTPVKFSYQSTINKTSAELVNVNRRREDKSAISFVRHHAFIPRFEVLDGMWYLIITPTYYFTVDGFIPHSYPDALLSGKKRLETNASLRGQIIMWHRYLTQDQLAAGDMFADSMPTNTWPTYGELPEVLLPQTVPEGAWAATNSARHATEETMEASLFHDA